MLTTLKQLTRLIFEFESKNGMKLVKMKLSVGNNISLTVVAVRSFILTVHYFTFHLFFLFSASLQLNCDKGKITAHIGGKFLLICTYDTKHFLFSKKYWCRGDSRSTCEIVVDSENTARTINSHRSHIVDTGRRGLFVKITDLRFDDSGVYWVGIERPYTDVMTSVKVVITEGKNKELCFMISLENVNCCYYILMTSMDIFHPYKKEVDSSSVLIYYPSLLRLASTLMSL